MNAKQIWHAIQHADSYGVGYHLVLQLASGHAAMGALVELNAPLDLLHLEAAGNDVFVPVGNIVSLIVEY